MLAVGATAVAGCSGNEGASADKVTPANEVPEWPAPDDPIERTAAAGLTMEVREHLQTHRHAHLDVFVDGEPVPVPAAIGTPPERIPTRADFSAG